jgi:hypothetical protein
LLITYGFLHENAQFLIVRQLKKWIPANENVDFGAAKMKTFT